MKLVSAHFGVKLVSTHSQGAPKDWKASIWGYKGSYTVPKKYQGRQ